MLCTLLKCRYLPHFEHGLSKQFGAENVKLIDSEPCEIVIRDVDLKYISRRAIRV